MYVKAGMPFLNVLTKAMPNDIRKQRVEVVIRAAFYWGRNFAYPIVKFKFVFAPKSIRGTKATSCNNFKLIVAYINMSLP